MKRALFALFLALSVATVVGCSGSPPSTGKPPAPSTEKK